MINVSSTSKYRAEFTVLSGKNIVINDSGWIRISHPRHLFLLLFLYDHRRHADAIVLQESALLALHSSLTAALSRSLGHHSLFLSAEEEEEETSKLG